jgi:uncharacterized membrane protein YfhO
VKSWDGKIAVVDHDGACILVLRRTFYPGWTCRINDGPEQTVIKVNGGLQGVLLAGSETSRIALRYQPTGLTTAVIVTSTAIAVAIAVLGATGWKATSDRKRQTAAAG